MSYGEGEIYWRIVAMHTERMTDEQMSSTRRLIMAKVEEFDLSLFSRSLSLRGLISKQNVR